MQDNLNLNITDIGPDGRHVKATLSDSEVRELLAPAQVDLQSGKASASLSVNLTLEHGDAVVVRGCVEGDYWTSCSRCLGPAHVRAHEPDLRHRFVPAGRDAAQGETETELTGDSLETAVHDGVRIDLAALVRDVLVLALPIAPLCRGECGGLAVDQASTTDPGFRDAPWKLALRGLTRRGDD